MKARDCIDRLGNPIARASDSFDIEGVYIIAGVIMAIIIVALWLRN
jgi:hypothetical protein